jgi:PDZ domain
MNADQVKTGSNWPARIACLLTCALLSTMAAMAAEEKTEASRADMEQKLQDAQKRLDAAAREVADLSMALSDDVMPHVMHFVGGHPGRAMLGVNIGSTRNDTRDEGIEILSVSPGGAAAEAGLKAGDVLTEINGKSLKRSDDGSPRTKLLTAMRDIKPKDKVSVKYLRDGKTAVASVVAGEPVDHLFNMPVGVGAVGALPGIPPLPHFAFMRAEGVFGAAELVPLTPKLGQYFGSDKGLLVVRAPTDTRLKLEEGDVILDIDGRTPSSPTHALRILTSYQAGEKLKLNVLRMKKRLTFDITIPEGTEDPWERKLERSGLHSGPQADVVIPAPPAPPAPFTKAVPGVPVTPDGPI